MATYYLIYIYIPIYFIFAWLLSISEEGIFRGCILGQLSRKYSSTTAILFSSTLFGLYHIYYIPLIFSKQLVEILFQASYAFHSFTAGLFLAYFYYKTDGNLLGPVVYYFSSIFFNVPLLWTKAAPHGSDYRSPTFISTQYSPNSNPKIHYKVKLVYARIN